MEYMKYLLDSIGVILKENNGLPAYSAARILLSDLSMLADENIDIYPGIIDIKEKIIFIEKNLLSYLSINVEEGFSESIHYKVNSELDKIRTILHRDSYSS